MGDVAALPQADALAHLVGPLKPAKTLEGDSESPPDLSAETPPSCHGRGTSGDAGGVVVVEKAGRAEGADFPAKGVQAAIATRSPSTGSDTPNPRRTGAADADAGADAKSRKAVIVSAASAGTDTEVSSPQGRQQQQHQGQQPGVFERMDIRRVGSTAESVVDSWTPSLAGGAGAAGGNGAAGSGSKAFDTVTDSQSTLRLSLTRPASKRVSLSRFVQLFASAATTVAADGEDHHHEDVAAAAAAAGAAAATAAAAAAAAAAATAADAGGSDTTGDDGEFDTANPLFLASADEEAETLQVGRPASRRGAIPIFATAEGLGYGAGPTPSEDGQSAEAGMGGGASVFSSRNPMYGVGVPVPRAAGGGVGDGGSHPAGLRVDCSRPIALDDLRGGSSAGSSNRACEDGEGEEEAAVATAAATAAALSAGSPAEGEARGDSMAGSEDSFGTDDTTVPQSIAASAVSADTAPDDAPTTPDSRISPFDADNASLWVTAAAASAAAAAAAAPTPRPASVSTTKQDGNNLPPLPRHSRPRSGSAESAATAASAAEPPSIARRLRRAASGVGLLHISASSRVFPSNGRGRRVPRTASLPSSSTGMLPPAPHSGSALAGAAGGGGGVAPHKLEGLGGGDFAPGGWQQPEKDAATQLDKLEAGGSRAPAFGGDVFLGKTPLMSPLGSSPSSSYAASTADETEASSGTAAATAAAESLSPRSASLARARVEVEGDVEEGGSAATTAAASGTGSPSVEVMGGSVAGVTAAEVGAALTAATATAEQVEVLPCAPSDDEKIIYRNTGRFGLISCAMLSFVTLTWGMWLFTIVTPAFYWFGAPAIFIIFYTGCHYLGVAVWGKDFRLKDHAEVVRRSEEKGYRPTVDVFLPVCKEPLHLLANTWRHVSALDYPDLKVFVLDDGKSDEVKALAATFGFEYVLRANAPELKKAGNLRNAFERTSGDAIAIFDADFCPRPDFLKETVPYLGEDPSVGIVQTPQYFRHRKEQTWVEQGAGVSQEFFYRMVQMNQDRFNAAVCVGSCGLYRRAALEPLGGMAAIEHSEDMYTGYKMTEHGFKIKYVPLALAMGICPDEPQSFFMQQYRWCKGSATLVREREFWQSNISRIHKLCFLNGMLYYMATALLIFLAPIPILLLVWMRADGVLWYHSGFVLPSIVFAGLIMPLWSKQRYGMSSHRVKVIQCYAHLYAIKDTFMGTHAPWVPSGANGARSKKLSGTYKSSVRLMVVWNVLVTAMIVGGSAWRMTELTWYHFVPAMALAVGSFFLNMSTLVY